MPVLLGEGLKQSFKVGGVAAAVSDEQSAVLYQQCILPCIEYLSSVLGWLVEQW
jgi:hypothetical protein